MTKVMWLSRHDMTEDQINQLTVAYGEVEVVKIDRFVAHVADIREEMKGYDVFAVVLPPALLMEMLREAGDKPVLEACFKARTLGGKPVFVGWNVVVEMKKVVRPLLSD